MCVYVWLRLARLCYAKTSLNAICMHWMLHVPGANPTRTRRQRLRLRQRRRRPDDPSVAMMSWTLPATSHPIPTSLPLPNPLPLLSHLSVQFPLSFSRQSCHIWFFGQCSSWQPCATITILLFFGFLFFFFVLLPTTSNNWKYAAYYFPFFHFSFAFPFCFNSFRNFQSEKPTKASPNRQNVLLLFASFVFSKCVCLWESVSVCKCRSTRGEGRNLPTTHFIAEASLYVCNLTFKYINSLTHTHSHTSLIPLWISVSVYFPCISSCGWK